jgi:hypothetical protein
VKNSKEKLVLKIKSDKKTAFYLLLIGVIFLFYIFGRFDFSTSQSQKLYQARVAKTEKIDDKLLKLKLNQKCKNFGIPNLHESDTTIVNYSKVSYKNDTFYILNDGSNQKVTVPKYRDVVILHKKDGSQVYYHNNYFFTKIEG